MSHCPSCGGHVRTHGEYGHILGCGVIDKDTHAPHTPHTGWEQGRWNVYATNDVIAVLRLAIKNYDARIGKPGEPEKAKILAEELGKAIRSVQP